jgi:Protein ChrB, N-terminal
MDDGDDLTWVLLVPHVPAVPSSARVQLWRHLRAAGALSVQNGVWVLPATAAHEQTLRDELALIVRQGGTGLLFRAQTLAQALGGDLGGDLVGRFRAERDQEYAEVCERCQALSDELARETQAGKQTFAELEENEHDLAKLERWLTQIQARDFFAASLASSALAALAACRVDLAAFTVAVYQREGLMDSTDTPETLDTLDTKDS